MRDLRIRCRETLRRVITITLLIGSISCYSIDDQKVSEPEMVQNMTLRDEVDSRFHRHLCEKIVPDRYRPNDLFQEAKDHRIGRDLGLARRLFEEIIKRVHFYLNFIDLPYEEDRAMIALALIGRGEMASYRRDSTYDIPTNKQLLKAYLKDILALVYNELAIVAWWDDKHLLAKDFYVKSAYFGHPEALKHIAELSMQNKIVLTKEERSLLPLEQQFFLLCKKKGWEFPINKLGFQFGYRTYQMTHTGNIIEDVFGLYAKELKVVAGSVLSFPVIWVSKKRGLENQGKIRTQLLIVGKKKVSPKGKKNRDKSSGYAISAVAPPPPSITAIAAAAAANQSGEKI